MTAPGFDITPFIPLKWKPWIGAIGAILTFVVPTVTQLTANLEQPWPTAIAAVIAGLTWLGIYRAPYVPPGAVLAPDTPAVAAASAPPAPVINPATGTGYTNPWQ